jgi:gas vesicle protein
MIKSVGILIGGIFVGAVGAEIIRKKYSKPMKSMYDKTCEITSEIKEAFKKGYANAMQSQEVTKPSV